MNKLPESFLNRMKLRIPESEFPEFIAAYKSPAPQCIRLNPKKKIADFDNLKSVEWLDPGKFLPENKQFITDPLWHAGAYYVQESSSMILNKIFTQLFPNKKPQQALDLCAAPGGKSTLLQSLLGENSILIANEVIKPRAQILKENHIRLGISENIIITQNDPKHFSQLDEFFDYIQVDAPCSGEGMFRKDETAFHEWSEANCQLCSERSKRILADVLPALAKDGYIVYSTCTFNPKENEELISWACKEFDLSPIRFEFPADWGITETEFDDVFGYYFYPHKVKGEGLFISVIKKNSGYGLRSLPAVKKGKNIQIHELIENENIIKEDGNLIWETDELGTVKNFISDKLNIIYSGIELGELKGKDFIPAQALASFYKHLHVFPEVDIDAETALQFLRGNDPQLSLNQKGIYLLTYQNLGLGFIKFIGNRSNNYYPKPWRIKNY